MVTNSADEGWMWRSPLLGTRKELSLTPGVVECFDRGTGPVIVFAHGWMANANLWRKVVDALAATHRCITLDLPLGAHRRPVAADAALDAGACGELIAEALEVLNVEAVTLVGNDSGGAYSQIATSRHPERVARLVLNSCETIFDEFPPAPFDGLPAVATSVDDLGALMGGLRDPATRSLDVAFGWLVKHQDRVEELLWESYTLACLNDDRILRNTAGVMSGASTARVHEAGALLVANFDRPVSFVWCAEDRVFPVSHAYRYAAALPNATVTLVEDAFSFTPEDNPDALAAAISEFAAV